MGASPWELATQTAILRTAPVFIFSMFLCRLRYKHICKHSGSICYAHLSPGGRAGLHWPMPPCMGVRPGSSCHIQPPEPPQIVSRLCRQSSFILRGSGDPLTRPGEAPGPPFMLTCPICPAWEPVAHPRATCNPLNHLGSPSGFAGSLHRLWSKQPSP